MKFLKVGIAIVASTMFASPANVLADPPYCSLKCVEQAFPYPITWESVLTTTCKITKDCPAGYVCPVKGLSLAEELSYKNLVGSFELNPDCKVTPTLTPGSIFDDEVIKDLFK